MIYVQKNTVLVDMDHWLTWTSAVKQSFRSSVTRDQFDFEAFSYLELALFELDERQSDAQSRADHSAGYHPRNNDIDW
jgi:hypothetical protein